MLVLSRKVGEKVVIGSDIVITVVEVRGNRIRLGIQAPDDVRVLRSELMFEMPAEPTVPTAKGDQPLWIEVSQTPVPFSTSH